MRTMLRGGILGLVFWAALPTDAAAALGWIEKLSGPGPFIGWQVNVPFGCYGIRRPPVAASQERGAAEQALTADDTQGRRFFISYDCLDAKADGWPVKFGIDVGRLSSKENELPYPGVDPRQKPNVNVLLIIPSATITLGGYGRTGDFLDIGAGIGVARFSDDRDFFETFWRPAIQPVRIGFKPLALIRDSSRWEFIEISANATIFAGDMTAADFGAAGAFAESNELVLNTALRVDLYKLFRRPTSRR